MPDIQTDDEFDRLSDDFEGVNFDSIPDLADKSYSSDNFVAPTVDGVSEPASPAGSSDYSCDGVIDASFLAQVDALENGIKGGGSSLAGVPEATTMSSSADVSRHDTNAASNSRLELNLHARSSTRSPDKRKGPSGNEALSPLKREYPDSLSSMSTSIKKGKTRADPEEGIRQMLEDFEDEITCPICCDIFVAAHIGNPCGHSFCGDCGWQWISKCTGKATCAICRETLSAKKPMIPIFTVDNTVEKHIQALGSSGNMEWQPGGRKLEEWNERKEKWKESTARIARVETNTASGSRRQAAPIIDLVSTGSDTVSSAGEGIDVENATPALPQTPATRGWRGGNRGGRGPRGGGRGRGRGRGGGGYQAQYAGYDGDNHRGNRRRRRWNGRGRGRGDGNQYRGQGAYAGE